MATERLTIAGIFSRPQEAAAAIRELRADGQGSGFRLERVHSPIPDHAIAEALQLPRSRVGWFTLAGGIIGFLSGITLAMFTADRWALIVSGKPVIALVPFFIVGFEFTILFSVFGNILGLISQARLPRIGMPDGYDPRFSGGRFGVLASCDPEKQQNLLEFFKSRGAEIGTAGQAGSGAGR